MSKAPGRLFVPALRARMGDWIYYICFMRMGDISARVVLAEEIHKAKRLRELIQRELTDRADDIGDYLLSEQQRFFNALVVGVYGGQPDWYDLKIGSNELLKSDQLPAYISGSLGVLRLTGREQLFALDGQHRVAGIRKAVRSKPGKESGLSDEEVACIFVGHKRTASGMRRTRRLFTTLNRHAKPVSLAEIIALDEDDLAAIVTRTILEDAGMMRADKVSFSKSRAMTGDTTNITNVTTLYTCHSLFLGRGRKPTEWRKYRLRRPDDATIRVSVNEAKSLWESLQGGFKPLDDVSGERKPASAFRNERGGHLLFRPIGLEIAVDAISRVIVLHDLKLDQAIKRFRRVPMKLNQAPWKGVIWTESGMDTAKGRKALARDLILYMMGSKFWSSRQRRDDAVVRLRGRLASAMNRQPEEVRLPTIRS